MSGRATVLARIREANAAVAATREQPLDPVLWEYGRATPMPDVLARFVERVEDYRAVVVRVPAADVGAAVADAIRAHGAASVVVPSGTPQEWTAALDADVRSDQPPLVHTELDATDAVITGATVGIAETGTIVLDHGAGQGRRAISLVPDLHVCVVSAEQVVSDVPEAVARLTESVRAGRPLTWISGPSATSDIELSRVEGVHGPRTLHVILLDG